MDSEAKSKSIQMHHVVQVVLSCMDIIYITRQRTNPFIPEGNLMATCRISFFL